MDELPERGAPSSLRGWLSEVYLPALVSAKADQLLRRLGDRATVDDPFFGRASGGTELEHHLHAASGWLMEHGAAVEPLAFTTGSDRDVTEGTLTVKLDGQPLALPVAVVAERRPGREVEIRIYYAARALRAAGATPPSATAGGSAAARAQLVPRDDELAVPPPVAAHLLALARGDVGGVVASFEAGATLRDPTGRVHAKEGAGGPLRSFYEGLFAGRGERTASGPLADPPLADAAPGIGLVKGARADDGRSCVLEYTMASQHGERVPPQPGLAVYVRGESGLLRALRLYAD